MINKLFRNSLGVIKEINSYFLNIEEVVGVDIYDILIWTYLFLQRSQYFRAQIPCALL